MTKRFVLMHFEGNSYVVDLTQNRTVNDKIGIGTYEVLDSEKIVELLNELDEKQTDYYSSNEALREEVQRLEADNIELKEAMKRMMADMMGGF